MPYRGRLPPVLCFVGWLRAAGGCGLTPRRRLPLSLLLQWNVPLSNVGIVVGAFRRNAMLSDVEMVVGMMLSLAVVVMMAGLKSLRGVGMVVGIIRGDGMVVGNDGMPFGVAVRIVGMSFGMYSTGRDLLPPPTDCLFTVGDR